MSEAIALTGQEYIVTIEVKGTYTIGIPAPNLEKAKERANQAVENADFGSLSNIDWDIHHVEDSNGNYIENEG